MKFDLSIVIPGIRTPNWVNLYESTKKACKKYKWEIIFISPFDLPDELKDKDYVLLVKSLGVCRLVSPSAIAIYSS